MPAWGGKRALFGTNPIAAVFPRRAGAPVTIDLSLSEAARGKIMVAAQQGKEIPLGWALDAQGAPTTDASAAIAPSTPMDRPRTDGGQLSAMAVIVCKPRWRVVTESP